MARASAIGPIIMGISEYELTANEREYLQHPLIGGVILFKRNYSDKKQLQALTQSIRKIRTPILIAVDQEGGPVQRFQQDFTPLIALEAIGERYQQDAAAGLTLAQTNASIMANECLQCGIDFSFAPVLDLYHKDSQVLAQRCFSSDAHVVATLARVYIEALHAAGMKVVGKHFPGHGGVSDDSHSSCPNDTRNYSEIEGRDLLPYNILITDGLLDSVLVTHVCYPSIDASPAGYSEIWLKDILRKQFNFSGAIFSDDLDMTAARTIGDYPKRVKACLRAGCDMALICNDQAGVVAVLDDLQRYDHSAAQQRLLKMKGISILH